MRPILALHFVTFILGAVGIYGWLGGELWLTSFGEGHVTMKLSTSVLSFLSGAAGIFRNRENVRVSMAMGMHAVLAATLGSGVVDARMIPMPDSPVDTIKPGFPSWATIFCFALIAISRIYYPSKWMSYAVMAISISAIVGHIVNVDWLYWYLPGYSTGMAIPTGIALFCAGAAMCREYHISYPDGQTDKCV